MSIHSNSQSTETSKSGLTWHVEPVIEWLLKEGRFVSSVEEFTRKFGDTLLKAGAPLSRIRLSMRTLHPLVAASTTAWSKDEDFIEPIESAHGIEQLPAFLGSPFSIIIETESVFRKRLEEPLGTDVHTALHEIKEGGGTDYFGMPLPFTEKAFAILACTTDRRGGFDDSDITQLTRLAAVLAPVAEVYSEKRVSRAIAQAYLGDRTGQRVLNGQIRRGDIEQIDAAILMSDIRDWTGLNTRVSGEEALAMANRYFDIISDAIEENGGEILKFIGDSVLAVFPLDGDALPSALVCEQALATARQAVCVADEIQPPLNLEFGIGMHFGQVHYGNIGSKSRIDFTVMGQAVNTTARIESLCSALSTPILFSESFANQLSESSIQVAEEVLKGFDSSFKVMTTLEFVKR